MRAAGHRHRCPRGHHRPATDITRFGHSATSHAATTTSTTTITTAVGVAPGSEGDPATTTSIAGTAPGSQTAPDPVLPDRGPISGN